MASAVTPSDAATVVLLRPRKIAGTADGPMEVLLTRRPDSMVFAGGNFVFPGGRVDPADSAPDNLELSRGIDPARAARILGDEGSPERSLGFWLAGIRKLFEETGVLLCTTVKGRGLEALDISRRGRVVAERADVQRRRRTLASLLREHGLRYDPTALRYMARWVTPAQYPVRFDTRFFFCQMPPGQQAVVCTSEVAESRWMEAGEVIRAWRGHEMKMLSPTVITLMYLAQYPTVSSLFALHEEGRQRVQVPLR